MPSDQTLPLAAEDLQPAHLARLYAKGVNITKYLKTRQSTTRNNSDIIEMAYELQSGSYVERLNDPDIYKFQTEYTSRIAKEISALCEPSSVMEAGVGEATTLGFVARNLGEGIDYHGFDLSWSRLTTGNKWLKSISVGNVRLCMGDLATMPYADNAIDVVYTSHSIEPNGGREEQILRELYRVANKFLVLFEPDYENASDEAKARMDEHGYCKDLVGTAERLGMTVLKHEFLPASINPLNPTGVTVIRKATPSVTQTAADKVYSCPVSRGPLQKHDSYYYCRDSLLAYPIIAGIPCLRQKHAIVCCRMGDVVDVT